MKFTEKDKEFILEGAMALEYSLACANASVDIGNALGHAQAVLAELIAAGFAPKDDLEFTRKDKSLILDCAIKMEYAIAQVSGKKVDIGNALGHAQAVLAELMAAGFTIDEDEDEGDDNI